MALTDTYLTQAKNLPQILESIRQAQPPERLTYKFLENLDFKSTNDRPIISVLKALGFIDESGAPKQPYYDFMDDEKHRAVLGEGIRRAYADLFKLNNEANKKDAGWVKNKLKALTQGSKSDVVLARMAATFVALCKEADFGSPTPFPREPAPTPSPSTENGEKPQLPPAPATPQRERTPRSSNDHQFALAYNIHIELPAVRDQGVYDAIFKSLRENLL